jgi:hypothetical protein
MTLYMGRLQYTFDRQNFTLSGPGGPEQVRTADLARRQISYVGRDGRPITITEAGLIAAGHREGPREVREYLQWLQTHEWKVSNVDYSSLGEHKAHKFRLIEDRIRGARDIPYVPVADFPSSP